MQSHRTRTLWLCALLHGFTHVYQVALIPLYVLMRKDLNFVGEDQAPFLVTAMGIAYCLPSYPFGILADRWNRKTLMAVGLGINALAFIALAMVHSYAAVFLSVLVAGIGGSVFHPCATSLVARLFPEATGKALGRMGIGAGVGFFVGPIYAGWRAANGNWRAPTMELGIAGVAMALIFWWLADNQQAKATKETTPAHAVFSNRLVWVLLCVAATLFSLRDFAGCGMTSMGSLYLQHAHGFTPAETGMAISCIFLAAAVSNPLFGSLSDRGRIRWSATALSMAALIILAFPWISGHWFGLVFAAYGFFFMASYPMVEAGLMELVPDSMRGRAFGLFITAGGVVGNLGHWCSGRWVNSLGAGAATARNYAGIYGTLSALVLLSASGLACMHWISRIKHRAVLTQPAPALVKG
jgi:MFS family permease